MPTSKSDLTDSDVLAGRARGQARAHTEPRADVVRYDATSDRIVMTLRSGALVAIPATQIHEFAQATAQQLAKVRASRFGDAVELPELDVDISVAGLLRDLAGELGSAAAVELGRRGGSAKTNEKAAAARANGAKGGRPRRVLQTVEHAGAKATKIKGDLLRK